MQPQQHQYVYTQPQQYLGMQQPPPSQQYNFHMQPLQQPQQYYVGSQPQQPQEYPQQQPQQYPQEQPQDQNAVQPAEQQKKKPFYEKEVQFQLCSTQLIVSLKEVAEAVIELLELILTLVLVGFAFEFYPVGAGITLGFCLLAAIVNTVKFFIRAKRFDKRGCTAVSAEVASIIFGSYCIAACSFFLQKCLDHVSSAGLDQTAYNAVDISVAIVSLLITLETVIEVGGYFLAAVAGTVRSACCAEGCLEKISNVMQESCKTCDARLQAWKTITLFFFGVPALGLSLYNIYGCCQSLSAASSSSLAHVGLPTPQSVSFPIAYDTRLFEALKRFDSSTSTSSTPTLTTPLSTSSIPALTSDTASTSTLAESTTLTSAASTASEETLPATSDATTWSDTPPSLPAANSTTPFTTSTSLTSRRSSTKPTTTPTTRRSTTSKTTKHTTTRGPVTRTTPSPSDYSICNDPRDALLILIFGPELLVGFLYGIAMCCAICRCLLCMADNEKK